MLAKQFRKLLFLVSSVLFCFSTASDASVLSAINASTTARTPQKTTTTTTTTTTPRSAKTTTTTTVTTPIENEWHFDIAPYIWFVNLNGRVGVKSLVTHVDQNFGQILNELNLAGMVWLDAYKGRFSVFLNMLYANLGNDFHDGPYTVDLTNHYSLFSAGIAYEVFHTCLCKDGTPSIRIEPYTGVRYTNNDTNMKFTAPGFSSQSNRSENWTDLILGTRVKFDLTKAWSLLLAGDIGGTNAKRQYSYNVLGLIGYKTQMWCTDTTAYIGYRLLDQRYTVPDWHTTNPPLYNWNMKLFGPVAGIRFNIA